jgi:hypothetical protein
VSSQFVMAMVWVISKLFHLNFELTGIVHSSMHGTVPRAFQGPVQYSAGRSSGDTRRRGPRLAMMQRHYRKGCDVEDVDGYALLCARASTEQGKACVILRYVLGAMETRGQIGAALLCPIAQSNVDRSALRTQAHPCQRWHISHEKWMRHQCHVGAPQGRG